LKTFCHSKGCHLFYTKEGSIPGEFQGCVSASDVLREKKERGLKMRENDFPFWAIEAYKTSERSFDKANAEYQESRKEGEPDESLSLDQGGDTSTFDNVMESLGIKNQSKAVKP
jgi:hypothetical protein